MKTALFLTLLTLPLLAEAPKKPIQGRYNALHSSSPFTTPAPVITSDKPIENPLADWALGGVTKFPDGFFVILLNKKKPDERVVIQPGRHSEFKVLEVIEGGMKMDEDGKMDYSGTSVKLMHGTTQGVVSYDDKLLTIKNPQPAQQGQQQAQPGMQQPAMIPGFNGNRDRGNDRQPRIRTITPPQPNQPQVPQQ